MKFATVLVLFGMLFFSTTLYAGDITVHPENWRYLYYNDRTLCLTSSGSTCQNFNKLMGDHDPSTIDCSLDEMAKSGINHFVGFIEMREGKSHPVLLDPFDYYVDISWNETFFLRLKDVIQYAYELDIVITIICTSEISLEPWPERWELNIFNQEMGGPVPSPGSNFFQIEEPEGEAETWTWGMWNYHYQRGLFEKILSTVSNYPNVIINPCWGVNRMGMSGYKWFETVCGWIEDLEESPHLISLTSFKPNEFCGLECVDCFVIQNIGMGEEFLDFRKPVINAGPSFREIYDEPAFMFDCALAGIHPSTNLNYPNRCPEQSEGYVYASMLQTFLDSVETWYDEPGDEIIEENLPSLDGEAEYPVIYWVDGQMTQDYDVTISGDGFGVHPDYDLDQNHLCKRWKNFEDYTGDKVSCLTDGGWFIFGDRYDEWNIANGGCPGGNHYANRSYMSTRLAGLCHYNTDTDLYYDSFWFMMPSSNQSGKFWRLWFMDEWTPNDFYLCSGGNNYYLRGCSECLPQTQWSSPDQFQPNTWHRIEVLAIYEGSGQGIFSTWIDGKLQWQKTDWWQNADYAPEDKRHMIGAMLDPGSGSYNYDNIYINYTQARVEVGNESSFESCTYRDVQVPTDWSNTSITVTVNQGIFSEGETAYLFVVDENGVASEGYPITIE